MPERFQQTASGVPHLAVAEEESDRVQNAHWAKDKALLNGKHKDKPNRKKNHLLYIIIYVHVSNLHGLAFIYKLKII